MKVLKNKFLVGVLCIVIGLAVGFFLLPTANENLMTETTVVKIVTYIEKGTQITDEMVETVTVQEGIVQNGILQGKNAIGKYAVSDMYEGDFVTHDKISDISIKENLLQMASAKDKKVVSITLPSLASGVSGKLQSGDIVTVIATDKNSNTAMVLETDEESEDYGDETYIVSELKYIEVCMLTTSSGSDAKVESNPTDEEKNELPVTISFYVNEEQALKLAEIEQNAYIHIVFVARGTETKMYIADEDKVITSEVD